MVGEVRRTENAGGNQAGNRPNDRRNNRDGHRFLKVALLTAGVLAGGALVSNLETCKGCSCWGRRNPLVEKKLKKCEKELEKCKNPPVAVTPGPASRETGTTSIGSGTRGHKEPAPLVEPMTGVEPRAGSESRKPGRDTWKRRRRRRRRGDARPRPRTEPRTVEVPRPRPRPRTTSKPRCRDISKKIDRGAQGLVWRKISRKKLQLAKRNCKTPHSIRINVSHTGSVSISGTPGCYGGLVGKGKVGTLRTTVGNNGCRTTLRVRSLGGR